jgi:hypothetical protein
MLSIGLWRWYINTIVTIQDITHRPVSYLKHNVSETGFCLRLQIEPGRKKRQLYRMGPTEYILPEDGDNTVPETLL